MAQAKLNRVSSPAQAASTGVSRAFTAGVVPWSMPSRTYKHVDFSIPQQVQDNAKKGLELRREHGFGGTKVGETTANLLVKGGEVSARKARHIASYFPRHAHDNLDEQGQKGSKPSRGYIAWLLWGGDAGRSWSEKLVKEMDQGKDKGAKAS